MSRQIKFSKYNILGVEIDSLTIKQAINYIDKKLSEKVENIYITKPYVEFMIKAVKDEKIAKILNNSELCLADGVSLQWAASLIYGRKKIKLNFFNLIESLTRIFRDKHWLSEILPQRMAGANFSIPLLRLCQKNNYRVGIVGGKAPQELMLNLKKIFPSLNLVGTWSGFFDQNQESKLVADIASKNLDILFVAMGFPRQEKFIYKNLLSLKVKIAIGEGGTFDYAELGGKIKRAPKWMQKIGLEWLWRLILQPSRFLRQLSIIKFIFIVYNRYKE